MWERIYYFQHVSKHKQRPIRYGIANIFYLPLSLLVTETHNSRDCHQEHHHGANQYRQFRSLKRKKTYNIPQMLNLETRHIVKHEIIILFPVHIQKEIHILRSQSII